MTVCGCGNQGRIQLAALARVRRLERVYAFDTDSARAEEFASDMSAQLGIRVEAVPEPGPAVRASDIAGRAPLRASRFSSPATSRPEPSSPRSGPTAPTSRSSTRGSSPRAASWWTVWINAPRSASFTTPSPPA